MKCDAVIGAIVGDIIGSRFEHHNIKTKTFDLFTPECRFTDDTVMTLAVASALLECSWHADLYIDNDSAHDTFLKDFIAGRMKRYGRRYRHRGYGRAFKRWIYENNVVPNNSYGNGAAMRISPVACISNSDMECKRYSELVTSVSHSHPEALKGAEAVALATLNAKEKMSINDIKKIICENYYNINFTLDDIRDAYTFDASCQGSVPQALQCFFESVSFEDAIRNAISIGGDSDTIAAITGSVAGAYYSVPEELRKNAMTFLKDDLREWLLMFEERFCSETVCLVQGR